MWGSVALATPAARARRPASGAPHAPRTPICARRHNSGSMEPVSVAPVETERTEPSEAAFAVPDPDVPWVTLVHNDPVNLMSYVTYVFQTYFGYSKSKATKLMKDVHYKGRA